MSRAIDGIESPEALGTSLCAALLKKMGEWDSHSADAWEKTDFMAVKTAFDKVCVELDAGFSLRQRAVTT